MATKAQEREREYKKQEERRKSTVENALRIIEEHGEVLEPYKSHSRFTAQGFDIWRNELAQAQRDGILLRRSRGPGNGFKWVKMPPPNFIGPFTITRRFDYGFTQDGWRLRSDTVGIWSRMQFTSLKEAVKWAYGKIADSKDVEKMAHLGLSYAENMNAIFKTAATAQAVKIAEENDQRRRAQDDHNRDLSIIKQEKELKAEAMFDLLKELTLALDEVGAFEGTTHGLQNGRIVAKGSFIELVSKARDLVGY